MEEGCGSCLLCFTSDGCFTSEDVPFSKPDNSTAPPPLLLLLLLLRLPCATSAAVL
jgi:hypothetical protein